MAVKTITDVAMDTFRPQREVKGEKISNFYPKESIFSKVKTFIDKKNPHQEHKITADWINVSISGKQISLHKGEALTEAEASLFSKEAKAHYLVAKSAKKAEHNNE